MLPGLERLRARIRSESSVITAYSGGADSALLAAVAHQELGERAVAVTAVSASLPESERRLAREFARSVGMAHVEVCTDELDRPEYVRNAGDRCAHCKSALFDAIAPLAALTRASVALATNVDDLADHRPGQEEARRRGAIFPLVDAGLSKAEVRAISRELGLPTADKPAAACLSSRIAYGDPVTPEVLHRIERAEDALHGLGYSQSRVRAHAGGTLARVEVPEPELDFAVANRAGIVSAVEAAGFRFVALDLRGFRSGSMNALLTITPAARP